VLILNAFHQLLEPFHELLFFEVDCIHQRNNEIPIEGDGELQSLQKILAFEELGF
jgi:hypothetical protein